MDPPRVLGDPQPAVVSFQAGDSAALRRLQTYMSNCRRLSSAAVRSSALKRIQERKRTSVSVHHRQSLSHSQLLQVHLTSRRHLIMQTPFILQICLQAITVQPTTLTFTPHLQSSSLRLWRPRTPLTLLQKPLPQTQLPQRTTTLACLIKVTVLRLNAVDLYLLQPTPLRRHSHLKESPLKLWKSPRWPVPNQVIHVFKSTMLKMTVTYCILFCIWSLFCWCSFQFHYQLSSRLQLQHLLAVL